MSWWLWINRGPRARRPRARDAGRLLHDLLCVAALVVGGVEMFGLCRSHGCSGCCSRSSPLLALKVFRRPLLERMRLRDRGKDDVDSLVGAVALTAGPIGPGGHGQAELRGTMWSARNVGDAPLTTGSAVVSWPSMVDAGSEPVGRPESVNSFRSCIAQRAPRAKRARRYSRPAEKQTIEAVRSEVLWNQR
jgi:membrane protein implicated in regulation of membrane protease activity